MSRVLGIVPARAGSKRIVRKNLSLLGGKPLVAWAIEVGLASPSIDCLVLSSDDPEAQTIARGYPDCVVVPRPPELASDTARPVEYVEHVLQNVERPDARPFDVIAILQPTSPFTRPEDVEATLTLLEISGADSAVSVVKLDHAIHPLKLKVLSGDRLLPYLEEERGRMAAHELPELYVRNCAVYATRRHVVAKGEIIGSDCRAYVMPRERSLDINDPLDLEFAEFLLARRRGVSS